MSFVLGKDTGIRRFGRYEAVLDKLKQDGENVDLWVRYWYEDDNLYDMADADNYIASNLIEGLEEIGIMVSKRERKGIFQKGTHMTFDDGYKMIVVSPYASRVKVGASGDRENLLKFFSKIESVLSGLE